MLQIALLGFGTVGSGVAEVLTENRDLIRERTGLDLNVKYILDLRQFPDHPLGDRVVHDIDVILSDPEVFLVAEMMGGLHPAYDFSLAALQAGKNVVTSNKAVVAEYGPELLREAEKRGLRYLFEASVGGGIPIIRPLTEQAAGNPITEICGILNGTTNYILTEMFRHGVSFAEALAAAQKLGYAEADPSADIDGLDTCRKICILAAVAFGVLIPYEKVDTVGIRQVTLEDVREAERHGYAVKLIARALKTDGGLYLKVEPMAVRRDNPLHAVEDVYNGILVRGTVSGDLMFFGKGAGKLPTAGAVVSDILDIASRGENQPKQQLFNKDAALYTPVLPEALKEQTLLDLGYPLSCPPVFEK